jgi:hypothetical protein
MTRFNIRTAGVGYSPDQSPEWLEERFKLFARYCAPSIAAQTEEDFDWLIYCDEDTPPEQLDRIRSFDSRIRIVLFANKTDPGERRSPASEAALAYPHVSPRAGTVVSTLRIQPHVRPGTDVVVSTRLDNDDALSRHALRRVRELVDDFLQLGHQQWLYNPMLGYKLDNRTQRLFPASKHNSPFLTLFEKVSEGYRPAGVCSGNHSHMHEQYPTFQDDSARMWLMVIHGGNVINGIGARDQPIPIENLGSDFPIVL